MFAQNRSKTAQFYFESCKMTSHFRILHSFGAKNSILSPGWCHFLEFGGSFGNGLSLELSDLLSQPFGHLRMTNIFLNILFRTENKRFLILRESHLKNPVMKESQKFLFRQRRFDVCRKSDIDICKDGFYKLLEMSTNWHQINICFGTFRFNHVKKTKTLTTAPNMTIQNNSCSLQKQTSRWNRSHKVEERIESVVVRWT
jgi:hypothetical protein